MDFQDHDSYSDADAHQVSEPALLPSVPSDSAAAGTMQPSDLSKTISKTAQARLKAFEAHEPDQLHAKSTTSNIGSTGDFNEKPVLTAAVPIAMDTVKDQTSKSQRQSREPLSVRPSSASVSQSHTVPQAQESSASGSSSSPGPVASASAPPLLETRTQSPSSQKSISNSSSSDKSSDSSVHTPGKSSGGDSENKTEKGIKRSNEGDNESPNKEINKETAEEEQQLKKKKQKQEEERMKMQVLVSNFSEEQLNAYEMFRRAAFPKASIKRLMQSITGSTIAQNIVIAMSGIAKVYVGEIVETALDVKEQWGDTGPLQPKHLREAVRRMKQTGSVPNTKYHKKLFR